MSFLSPVNLRSSGHARLEQLSFSCGHRTGHPKHVRPTFQDAAHKGPRYIKTGNALALIVAIGSLWLGSWVLAQTPDAALAPTPGTAKPVEAPKVEVPADASVQDLFVDFLHFARLGRFTTADAYAIALLNHPKLDPVAVHDAAMKDKKSVETLTIIIRNSSIGENAVKVLDLVHQGEKLKNTDAEQIRANIEGLKGDPQQEFYATSHLRDSGEYAVPAMIDTLLDPAQKDLWPRVIIAMAKLGREAVNPLVMALNMTNNDVRIHVIRSLGEIGYPQAIPYLTRLTLDEKMPAETKEASGQAIGRIGALSGRSVSGAGAEQFHWLADRYFNEDDGVRADPRLETANIWYWDKESQRLRAKVAPTKIFGPVMAMRSSEEALSLESGHTESVALWLAANIRRESRLGLDVESGDPNEKSEVDPTRPEVFPRALYFTQAAGPRHAHLVLQRAVRNNDSAVALGAIEALRITAGESSLVGGEDPKQALVQALRFPDLLVRLRAALALGSALPTSAFADSQNVVPLLASAVGLTGDEYAVVVDTDAQNLNRAMDSVRKSGRKTIGEGSFYRAMERARVESPAIHAFIVATDVVEPDLHNLMVQLRGEFAYSKTPVVLLVKPGTDLAAETIAKSDPHVEIVPSGVDGAAIEAALGRVHSRTAQGALDSELSKELALAAVATLRQIAANGRTAFDVNGAEAALILALASPDGVLQEAAAGVLPFLKSAKAQQAIADLALDAGQPEGLRVGVLGSLAESGKVQGNQLTAEQFASVLKVSLEEANLVIRTAATQALGALNPTGEKAADVLKVYATR